MAGALERAAQGGHAAVHHIGGREDIAAGLGLDQALLHQPFDGGVVEDPTALDDAVVAVVGERVERHVAHDPDLRRGVLHGPHRAADDAVGVGGLNAQGVLLFGVDMRENGDGGDAQGPGFLGGLGALGDGQALDPRHGGHRNPALSLVHDHGPQEIRRRQDTLAH